jgi:hypothetical protein
MLGPTNLSMRFSCLGVGALDDLPIVEALRREGIDAHW